MSEVVNIPQLRFPEFSGEWKEKLLKDLTKINQGLQIPIADRFTEEVENSYFYITNEFLKESSSNKYFIQNPTESVLCTENDVLMTRTGNTGQVVTNVNGAFHNNFFKIKYSGDLNKDFLVEFLRLGTTQNMILRYAGTSTIPDLNHGDFYRLKLSLPSKTEQQKIAAFLSAVDTKIELLRQKQELLGEYKKGVMQQIFSQAIRFKAGDGCDFPDWEEKKLGDIGHTFNGLTGKTKDDFGRGKSYIQYMQIFESSKINIDNFGLVDVLDDENQKVAQYGDVFFTTSSETPDAVGYSSVLLDDIDNLYLNSFCFGFRPDSLNELNPNFAQFLMRSTNFRKRVIRLAQGSTRYNMSKVQLMKEVVKLPCLEEQTKIANFLSLIDNKIEQVGKKLDKSKQFKKALLQQMFV